MNITATQLEAAFAEWVREFQRQAKEEGEDGVINFAAVDAEVWARASTPYFWTLLKRAPAPVTRVRGPFKRVERLDSETGAWSECEFETLKKGQVFRVIEGGQPGPWLCDTDASEVLGSADNWELMVRPAPAGAA